MSLGSLSNDAGDVNENGKKAIGLDWQNNHFAINIITDKLTTLITIALLATLETRQSKLSQRLLQLLLGTRNKLANS